MKQSHRKTKFWIFSVCIFGLLFVFRKIIFLSAVKMACSYCDPSFTYEKMYWDNGVIRISGVHVARSGTEIFIPDADLALSGSLFSWKLKMSLFHPEIILKIKDKTDSGDFLGILFTSSFLSWEVYDGVVHLEENPPLYFSFLPDAEGQTVGRIALSYEPLEQNLPLFTALLQKHDGALKVDFSLAEEDTSRLLPIALALFPELPRSWEQTQGKVEASGHVHLAHDGHLNDLSCQWHIEDLILESRLSGIELSAVQLSGTFASENPLSLDCLWQDGEGRVVLQGIKMQMSCAFPHLLFIDEGQIVLKLDHEPYVHLIGTVSRDEHPVPFSVHAEGMVHRDASFFLGLKAELQNELQLEGTICRFEEKKYAVDMHFKDLSFEHALFFSPYALSKGHWIEGSLDGKVVLLFQNEEIEIEGEITHGEETWTAGALFNQKNELQEGWFETEGATEATYAPVLKMVNPDLAISGKLQVKGNFDTSHLILSLRGSSVWLHHAHGDLWVSDFGENGAELIYDMKGKKIKGEIPLYDAKFSSKDVHVDSLHAQVHIDGNTLHIPAIAGVHKNTKMEGSIGSISLHPNKLRFDKVKMHWEMPDGTPYALLGVLCDIDWEGSLKANFHLSLERDAARMLECAGAAQQKREGGWEIALDRHRTKFLDVPLNVSGCHISKDNRRIALDMHPELSCQELSSALHWLKAAHFISLPNDQLLDNCKGSLQTRLSTQDLQNWCFTIQSKDLAYNGKKIGSFQLNGRYLPPMRFEIDSLSGEGVSMRAAAALQDQILHLTDIAGQIKGLTVCASGKIDLCHSAFDLILDSIAGSTTTFTPADKLSGHFTAHGTIQGTFDAPLRLSGDGICTLDLTYPLGLTVWNVTPLKISYAYDSGLKIASLNAYLKSKKENLTLGTFSCDECGISSTLDSVYTNGIRCSVDPLALKHFLPSIASTFTCSDKLEATGDMRMDREGFSCQAALKEGTFGIAGHALPLQKVGIQAKGGVFTVQAKTKIGEQCVWGALSLALTKNPQGILRVTDHPQAEGIRLHFRAIEDQLHWEKIHGSCFGLQCELVKQASKKSGATQLSGSVSIDGTKWPLLFPKSLSEKLTNFKIGKGYKWKGDLIVWQDSAKGFEVSGEITGEDWELLGYRFNSLRASLEAHPTRISLSNILVNDEAGSIGIKKVQIEKNGQWELSIPIVSVREWHPSSMKKIEAGTQEVKPFLIRNFTLSNIHANLEKQGSLQGTGKLTFTNQNKKESTLFDTPLEMIKNFGLDPGLLTPIQGEIDLDIQGSKMFLIGLKEAFSEAKRSEFYLAPGRDLSYIDLDGKMHIDLKMRQDVTLKITEPFVLTIRGTLEKPRYGLDLLP